MTGVDRELAAAREALLGRGQVWVFWKPSAGCAVIHSRAVRVLWPGSAEPVEVSDAELAALRRLELDGAVAVHWPWVPMRPDLPHAPLAEWIEAAARRLGGAAA